MTSSLMMRSEPSSVVRSLLQMTYFFVKLLNLLKRVLVSLSSSVAVGGRRNLPVSTCCMSV